MTAEKLHDAIGLLPADLVAETDVKRTKKARIIPWKRYAAMAACFVLILFGGLLFRSMLLPGLNGASKMAACEAAPQSAEAASAEDVAGGNDQEFGAASGGLADNSQTTAGTRDSGQSSQTSDAVPPDASPSQEYAASFAVRYVNTPDNLYSAQCYISGPGTTLVSSREDLDDYCRENQNQYILDAFASSCEAYDEAWFQTHDLLLIALDAIVPAGGNVMVTDILPGAEGWEVHIRLSQEDTASEYTTNWHILLETEKGLISSAEAVSLVFE